MVPIHREGGFRFAICRDDHEPAHVHVLGDGEVVVNLIGVDGRPEVRDAYGATRADIRKTMTIVTARQVEFMAKWHEMRDGTD
jgi:hypothetical protein